MGMFCKHSPNLVYGLGHPPVQLHPVLLLEGDPLPGTGILLLWLFGSLVDFISIIVSENHIDFDNGGLHHELNLCLDLLEGVLQDFPLL